MSADNIQLDALVDGDDVATDLIATDHYQIIKMTYGALGSQTLASSGAGAVDAGVARYTLASDDPAVALLGTMDADTGAIKTATETIAAAVSTQMQVDIVADGAGLLTTTAHNDAFGTAGTADAQVRSVQGIAGGTALPVSGTVTANPASGTIDTVTAVTDITNPITANPASGTIDTVSTVSAVTSLDPIVHVENAALGATPSGALAMARQDAALTATGSVDDDATPLTVDANGALWVTPSGTVTVDGSGVTQPVSGTVTANLSATDNAVLDTIDGVLDTINAKLASGTVIGDVNLGATDNAVLDNIQTAVDTVAAAVSTEMQVDIVGSLPAGTAAIGKLAANSGVDIGDVDVTSLPGSATSAATAFDSYTHAAINLTTGANQVLVSSAANKQIWVYGIGFSCSAAGTGVSFQDELDVAVTGIMTFAQYGGMAVNPTGNFEMPLWKLGTDKDLEVDITTGDVDGWITYAIVSV